MISPRSSSPRTTGRRGEPRLRQPPDRPHRATTSFSKRADGTLSARYWSEASKERVDPAGIFYYWNGERPRDPNAPQLQGTGEIKLESVDRADGYWTTRSEGADTFHARTSGIYLRADPGDAAVLNGNDAGERAALIEQRLEEWKSFANL